MHTFLITVELDTEAGMVYHTYERQGKDARRLLTHARRRAYRDFGSGVRSVSVERL